MQHFSTIKPANLTPHFRNLIREENPSWESWEIMRWTWNDGPVFCGKPIPTKDIDSRHSAGSAIGLMFLHIKEHDRQLTKNKRPSFII